MAPSANSHPDLRLSLDFSLLKAKKIKEGKEEKENQKKKEQTVAGPWDFPANLILNALPALGHGL